MRWQLRKAGNRENIPNANEKKKRKETSKAPEQDGPPGSKNWRKISLFKNKRGEGGGSARKS